MAASSDGALQDGLSEAAAEAKSKRARPMPVKKPEVQDLAASAGVPDDEIHKITWENACRFYNFDPFAHRSREQSTVGALRAEATDVDITLKSYGMKNHGPQVAALPS